MKIEIYKILEFDIEEAREHLVKHFKGRQRARLLNCLQLFEEYKFIESVEAYENLPYSNKDGCTEKEFMPMWYYEFFYTIFFDKFKFRKVENKEIIENQ